MNATHHLIYLPEQCLLIGTNSPPKDWESSLGLVGTEPTHHIVWSFGPETQSAYHWVRPIPKKFQTLANLAFRANLTQAVSRSGRALLLRLWPALLACTAPHANPTHVITRSGLQQMRQLVHSLPLPHWTPGAVPQTQHFQWASRKHSIQVLPVGDHDLEAGHGTFLAPAPWLLDLDLTTGQWKALVPTTHCGGDGVFEVEPHHLVFSVGNRKTLPWKPLNPEKPCAPAALSDLTNSPEEVDL